MVVARGGATSLCARPGQYKVGLFGSDWAAKATPVIHVIAHRPCADRWISIGPEVNTASCVPAGTCFTGRVLSVALIPISRIVPTSARAAAVWRSDDGTDSWYPVTDNVNLPGALAVETVAVAPARAGEQIGRVYAGTGDPHNDWFGVRSADGVYLSVRTVARAGVSRNARSSATRRRVSSPES